MNTYAIVIFEWGFYIYIYICSGRVKIESEIFYEENSSAEQYLVWWWEKGNKRRRIVTASSSILDRLIVYLWNLKNARAFGMEMNWNSRVIWKAINYQAVDNQKIEIKRRFIVKILLALYSLKLNGHFDG